MSEVEATDIDVIVTLRPRVPPLRLKDCAVCGRVRHAPEWRRPYRDQTAEHDLPVCTGCLEGSPSSIPGTTVSDWRALAAVKSLANALRWEVINGPR